MRPLGRRTRLRGADVAPHRWRPTAWWRLAVAMLVAQAIAMLYLWRNRPDFAGSYQDVVRDLHQITRVTRLMFILYLAALAAGAMEVSLQLRRKRRRKLGLCLACGYDLRASPGRCPECGTAPVTPRG